MELEALRFLARVQLRRLRCATSGRARNESELLRIMTARSALGVLREKIKRAINASRTPRGRAQIAAWVRNQQDHPGDTPEAFVERLSLKDWRVIADDGIEVQLEEFEVRTAYNIRDRATAQKKHTEI